MRLLDKPCADCDGPIHAKRTDRVRCDGCRVVHTRRRHRDDKRRARAADPAKVRLAYRKWQLASIYGLSHDEYLSLLEGQDGRCAICLTDNPGPKDWHVDHDHTTGRVRGVLCPDCNLTLGKVGDSVDTLHRMIAYLKGSDHFKPDIAGVLNIGGSA